MHRHWTDDGINFPWYFPDSSKMNQIFSALGFGKPVSVLNSCLWLNTLKHSFRLEKHVHQTLTLFKCKAAKQFLQYNYLQTFLLTLILKTKPNQVFIASFFVFTFLYKNIFLFFSFIVCLFTKKEISILSSIYSFTGMFQFTKKIFEQTSAPGMKWLSLGFEP